MAKALDGKDYQLVITGHSLGAGTAALVGLKLKARFPGQTSRPVWISTCNPTPCICATLLSCQGSAMELHLPALHVCTRTSLEDLSSLWCISQAYAYLHFMAHLVSCHLELGSLLHRSPSFSLEHTLHEPVKHLVSCIHEGSNQCCRGAIMLQPSMCWALGTHHVLGTGHNSHTVTAAIMLPKRSTLLVSHVNQGHT